MTLPDMHLGWCLEEKKFHHPQFLATMGKAKRKKLSALAAPSKRTKRAAIERQHVSHIYAEINNTRSKKGCIPRGKMKEILELHKEVYPWLNVDLIKNGLEKLKNERINLTASNISDLTNPSCFTSTVEPHNTNETNAIHL
jgi:hypothetical protein